MIDVDNSSNFSIDEVNVKKLCKTNASNSEGKH